GASERRALSAAEGDRLRDPLFCAFAAPSFDRLAAKRRGNPRRTRSSCGEGRGQEVNRLAACVGVALLVVGCGGSTKKKEAASPMMAPAVPQAAAKMISGAEFAKSPSGRERAIGL